MTNLIKKFKREALLNAEVKKIECNTIVIPQTFWQETIDICNGENEKAGWLICKKAFAGDHILYLVECMYTSTEGNSGSVTPKLRLTLSNDHTVIEFHVHPIGLGETWFDKFSDFGERGDIATLNERLNIVPQYKHVLFTPTHLLTFGKEELDIRIAKTNEESESAVVESKSYWTNFLNEKIQNKNQMSIWNLILKVE